MLRFSSLYLCLCLCHSVAFLPSLPILFVFRVFVIFSLLSIYFLLHLSARTQILLNKISKMRHIAKHYCLINGSETPLESHLNQQQTTCDSRTQVATNCGWTNGRKNRKLRARIKLEMSEKEKKNTHKLRDELRWSSSLIPPVKLKNRFIKYFLKSLMLKSSMQFMCSSTQQSEWVHTERQQSRL